MLGTCATIKFAQLTGNRRDMFIGTDIQTHSIAVEHRDRGFCSWATHTHCSVSDYIQFI